MSKVLILSHLLKYTNLVAKKEMIRTIALRLSANLILLIKKLLKKNKSHKSPEIRAEDGQIIIKVITEEHLDLNQSNR